MLQPGSRYHALAASPLTDTAADGRPVLYLPRRTLPPTGPASLPASIVAGTLERLDQVAARTLGNPEQFWRLCDANAAMNPFTLIAESGGQLQLPSPYGAAQWSSTLAIGREAQQPLLGLPAPSGLTLPGSSQ